MKKRLLALLLVFVMALCLLPASALAEGQTPAPRLSRTEGTFGPVGESCTFEFYAYYPTDGSYQTPLSVKVYDSTGTEFPPSSASVTMGEKVALTVTSCPDEEVTYYLGFTENGGTESERVPFIGIPYSPEGYFKDVIENTQITALEDNALTETAAVGALVSEINDKWATTIQSPTRTFTAADLELTIFSRARYGIDGFLNVTLHLDDVISAAVTMQITANPYSAGKPFDMESQTIELSFLSGDAENQKSAKATFYQTSVSVSDSIAEYSFTISENESSDVPPTGIGVVAGAASTFIDECQIPLTVDRPNADITKTLYLRCQKGSDAPITIGSFTLSVNLHSERTPTPVLQHRELAYGVRMAHTLNNAAALTGATYRVYCVTDLGITNPETSDFELATLYSASRRANTLLIVRRGMETGGSSMWMGITAQLPGMAESEIARFKANMDVGANVVLTGASTESDAEGTPLDVLASGQVASDDSDSIQNRSIAINEISAGTDDYNTLMNEVAADAGESIVAAYNINVIHATLTGSATLRFFAGLDKAGQWVAVLHKNSRTGAVDRHVVKVGSDGYGAVTVNSLSPFMLVEGVAIPARDPVTPQFRWYEITSGGGTAWNGERSGLSFTANGLANNVRNIIVDGGVVPPEHWTAGEISTILTLKKEFLKTLPNGQHTLRIVYNDGYADSTFYTGVMLVPDTGDSPATPAEAFAACLFAILAANAANNR